MLKDTDAIATVAVRDLEAAERFYSDGLGLKRVEGGEPGALAYKSGNSKLLVYRSDYAGTNQATSVSWFVDNVDKEVESLRSKGVTFEHYDLPDTKRDGDVHVAGKMRLAWFKDPDGNILGMMSH